jgi:hypothetical protein
MRDDERPAQVFGNRFAGAVRPGVGRDVCDCLRLQRTSVAFHAERQDTSAPGWLRLLQVIDDAIADGRTRLRPFEELTAEERRQVVTLPPSIGQLTQVRRLVLYGTNLVRLPPEIGALTDLEQFEPYTSYRLHWYPYELMRSRLLRSSAVSTRALYGNFKHRPPFPALPAITHGTDFSSLDPVVHGTESARTCSVCDTPLRGELHQAWISLEVAIDVLPLLVNACSAACIAALPEPAQGYVATPHLGGPDVVQPGGD